MAKTFRFINAKTLDFRDFKTKKAGCLELGLDLRLIDATKESYREAYDKLTDIEKSSRINPRYSNNGYFLEVIKDEDENRVVNIYGEDYKVVKMKGGAVIEKEGVVGYDDDIEEIEENHKTGRMSVLAGDSHWNYQDDDSIDILYQFCEDHAENIGEFIFGGDGVDASGLGKYVNLEENKYTIYEEMCSFSEYANTIREILPNAKLVMLSDNHFHLRLQRFLAENPAMKGMLKDIEFEFDKVVPHGIPYFPFSELGNNKIGGIHGINFNDNFTKKNTNTYMHDLFQFHTHTTQMYHGVNGLTSYGVPCLCKLDMAYLQGRKNRWVNGFATMTWFEEESRYTFDYCIVKDKVGVYRNKLYRAE